MKKIWKDIIGYEGLYQISDVGDVKRVSRGPHTQIGRILKQSLRGKVDYKYLCVCLYKNGQKKTKQVHIMVLETFVRPLRSDEVSRHLDGNRFNNKICNLTHGTQKENIADRCRHGNTVKGTARWNSKLNEKKVREIRLLYMSGIYTQAQLADKYGVVQTTVSKVIDRSTWKHVA
jgi:hypothetical protein